jgi:exodeoxyribonuclease VII large subunit
VARAIAASPIPVISGVGHETDFTIADFVADERAPTPSGAAERAVPDRAEFLRALGALERNLAAAMRRRLHSLSQALRAHEHGLARAHPGARLRQHAQRLDELEQRLQRAMVRKLDRARMRLGNAEALLARSSPARRLAVVRLRLDRSARQLPLCMQRRLQQSRERLERSMRTLHAVSPLATLERGYAIVLDDDGHVVTDAGAVATGASIEARVARGTIRATVVTTIAPVTRSQG